MSRAEIEKIIQSDLIGALDLSMFEEADVANIILQRSRVLYDVPKGGVVIRNWVAGNTAPLMAVVADKGLDIVRRALAIMLIEYRDLRPHLARFTPKTVADIGCGYGFIDLFIARDFDCDLVLIDIEESETRKFGYRNDGAGYSNLGTAKAFLAANGVRADAITLVNPRKTDVLATQSIDAAISLLSCGFHYPLSTYSDYLTRNLRDGGGVIVDIGEKSLAEQMDAITEIGHIADHYFHVKGTNRTVIQRG